MANKYQKNNMKIPLLFTTRSLTTTNIDMKKNIKSRYLKKTIRKEINVPYVIYWRK